MELSDKIPGTSFTWAQACYQPKWLLHVWPSSDQMKHIQESAQRLQKIKDLFPSKDLVITSWLRCEPYNLMIGGSVNSRHIKGMAVDFYIKGVSIKDVQAVLEPKLNELNICMERGTKTWVHIDTGSPRQMSGRYFYP